MSAELKKSYSRIINQVKCLSTKRSAIPANEIFTNTLIKSSIDSFRKRSQMRKSRQCSSSKTDLSKNDNATERIKETITSLTNHFNRNIPFHQTASNDYRIKKNSFEVNAQFNIKVKFNQMRHLLNQSFNERRVFVNNINKVNAVKSNKHLLNNNYRQLSECQSVESFASEFKTGFEQCNKTKQAIGAYPTLVAMGISVNSLKPSNSCANLGVRTRINLLNC